MSRSTGSRMGMSFLAAPLLALAIGGAALAGEVSPSCAVPSPDATAVSSEAQPLEALRPTFRIVAEDYDKKAAEFAEQAERYRTWASAEEMFGGSDGKRYAAIYFADQADALDTEAAENRALAAKYRQLATSHDAAKGC